jgi:hypothetical protein
LFFPTRKLFKDYDTDVKLDLPITPNGDENAEARLHWLHGEHAHKDIFFEYAKDHLTLGNDGRVYYSPNGVDSILL